MLEATNTNTMSLTQLNEQRQVELQQLQREYRNMDINRRAYAEESQSILRKQQMTIDKLRKENEVLRNDIAMIMRGSSRPLTNNQQEAMQQLTDLGDKYATSIEFERKNISIMEEQLHILRQKAFQQRKTMGGVNASKENHFMIQKQIRILENRLDKSLIKFNESVAHNKHLRDQIDDLRRERVVFENIYKKMERDLQDRKRSMAEIIEVSNQAYEQRDAFQMEVAAIEQANRKEQDEFDEQMSTLSHLLDTDLRLPTFGAGLGQKAKSLTKLNRSNLTSFPIDSLGSTGGASGGMDSSSPMRMSRSAGALGSAPSTAHPDDFRDRVQNFEEAFNKIKAATGINDIDQLVHTFIKNEEHNFSLFNYVNEQNNEVEKLEEHITALRDEESKFAQESGNDVNQHKEILKDLEIKLQNTDSMAEKYELRCQDLQRIIESMKRGMQSIFAKLELDANGHSISNQLEESGHGIVNINTNSSGAAVNITEINMVNLLGILEKKAVQLLQVYTSLRQVMIAPNKEVEEILANASAGFNNNNTNGGDMFSGMNFNNTGSSGGNLNSSALVTIIGAGPKVPMGTDHLRVNPPKADDYRSDDEDDDDDEETRPFTREELKSRTLNKLQKRLGQSSSAVAASNNNNNINNVTNAVNNMLSFENSNDGSNNSNAMNSPNNINNPSNSSPNKSNKRRATTQKK